MPSYHDNGRVRSYRLELAVFKCGVKDDYMSTRVIARMTRPGLLDRYARLVHRKMIASYGGAWGWWRFKPKYGKRLEWYFEFTGLPGNEIHPGDRKTLALALRGQFGEQSHPELRIPIYRETGY